MPNTPSSSNEAAPKQAEELTPWRVSYAEDRSHYTDFVILAASEDEALAQAEALLRSGELEQVMGPLAEEYDNGCTNARVFTNGEEDDEWAIESRTVEALAREAKVKLPDWRAVATEEPKMTADDLVSRLAALKPYGEADGECQPDGDDAMRVLNFWIAQARQILS